jgi:MGT family glycosyltransferase
MARVLAYTSPARGHLYPLTPILAELRRRGHEVALRTMASQVPVMNELGFDAAPIDQHIEAIEHDDWQASSQPAALGRSVATFLARARHDGPDLRAAIAESHPDVVVVDINSWGAMAAAEAWGGRWASFCPYPMPVSSRDAPPFGPGFPPARGPLGRLRDRLARPLVLGTVERVMMPKVNAVRREHGLGSIKNADALYARPPLLLYLTAEPFEYPRLDWPANVVMVGPCDWDPNGATPNWLEDIAPPIVLVASSSEFQGDGRLVQTALDALRDEPVFVIATLPAGDPGALRVPANARLERFVAHGPVLDRSTVMITHGGMGGTQKALARGVPVCAVPFGRDQFEVARRVEVAGAGTRLPAKRLTPERLRDKVRQAMTCGDGARRIAEAFAAAGGPGAAADAIERRIKGPT